MPGSKYIFGEGGTCAIRHRKTKLYYKQAQQNKLIDYSTMWNNQTNFYTPLYHPTQELYCYQHPRLYRNHHALMYGIFNFFLITTEVCKNDNTYNSVERFIKDFDIIDYASGKSILTQELISDIIHFYFRQKINLYLYMIGCDEAAKSINMMQYNEIFKVKYAIIYNNSKEARLNHIKFSDASTAIDAIRIENTIYFKENESFTICKILSNNHITIADLVEFSTIINNTYNELQSEILPQS